MVGAGRSRHASGGRSARGTRAPAVPHRADPGHRAARPEPRRGGQRPQPPPGAAERAMDDEAGTHASTLDASMARARTITLIMAHNAAFRGFYLEPGSRESKLRRGRRTSRAPTTPSSTSRACSPSRSASPASSTAAGRRTRAWCAASAPRSPTCRPTRRQPVLRARRSPCGPARSTRPSRTSRPTRTIGSSPTPRRSRRARGPLGGDRPLRAVTSRASARSCAPTTTTTTCASSTRGRAAWSSTARARRRSARRSACPATAASPALARSARRARRRRRSTGTSRRYRRLPRGAGNANDWILVAVARDAAPGAARRRRAGAAGDAGGGPGPLALGASSRCAPRAASSEAAATTDALTGLGNRRQLMADLERRVARRRGAPGGARALRPRRLQELQRHASATPPATRCSRASARRSTRGVAPHGAAYRLGGDEFCVLADADARASARAAAARRAERARRGLRDHRRRTAPC